MSEFASLRAVSDSSRRETKPFKCLFSSMTTRCRMLCSIMVCLAAMYESSGATEMTVDAGVFRYDEVFGYDEALTISVSDHYPVWITLEIEAH